MNETKKVEKEKIVAEKLNGRFAMIGFIALIGAYLTTGQIIPGFVYLWITLEVSYPAIPIKGSQPVSLLADFHDNANLKTTRMWWWL